MSSGLPRVLDRLIPLIDTPFLYGLQGYLGLARAPLSDSDLTLRTLAVVATAYGGAVRAVPRAQHVIVCAPLQVFPRE